MNKMRNFCATMNDMETKPNVTEKKLIAGLKECMRTQPVEEITVKQICAAAHLSRQSFYRCAKDKYDLVNRFFDRLLMESFHQMGQGDNIRDSLVKKFTFIQKEFVFFNNAFRTDAQNNLRDHDIQEIQHFYVRLLTRKTGSEPRGKILKLLNMYCVASVYQTVEWVLHDMQETPTELADLMIDALPEQLAKIFRTTGILTDV
jgi:AcrR family transcriptional regulator